MVEGLGPFGFDLQDLLPSVTQVDNIIATCPRFKEGLPQPFRDTVQKLPLLLALNPEPQTLPLGLWFR